MTQPQTIAVTGASGFVGRYLVRELVKRGHTVRALVRSPDKARQVLGPAGGAPGGPRPVTLVVGDSCDGRALAELIRGCTACINLIGIIREERGETTATPQTFERLHVATARKLLEACHAAGCRRFLQMSALGVGPEGRSRYQKSKWEAERIVRRSGLDWTVFRPSIIHGPDGEFLRLMADVASGEVAPFFFMPYFARKRVDERVPLGGVTWEAAHIQPIHVEDVASAFAEALERPASIGEVYNLAGPEVLNWCRLMEFLRDTLPRTKKNLSTWHVPGEHAAVIARVARLFGLAGALPYDEGQPLMAIEDNTADTTKARLDLHLQPRPFYESVEQYAALV